MVGNYFKVLESTAPEGYAPVVYAYLAGASGPIVVSVVETAEDGLTFIHSHPAARDNPEEFDATDRFVYVDSANVLHVELRFERKDATAIGFAHNALAGEPDGDALDAR